MVAVVTEATAEVTAGGAAADTAAETDAVAAADTETEVDRTEALPATFRFFILTEFLRFLLHSSWYYN